MVDTLGAQESYLHFRYMYIYVYVYVYRDNSNRKSNNSNSGCSLIEVYLDILWTQTFSGIDDYSW